MSNRPKTSAKTEQGEYLTFENALKKVLSVPHSALKAEIDREKRVRKQQKQRAYDRAYDEKD